MKKLTQDFDPRWSRTIENQLQHIFYRIIFAPIVPIIREAARERNQKIALNSNQDALQQAIRDGRIQYSAGVFFGKTNVSVGSALRSLGAKYNDRTGTYRLAEALVPPWVKHEALAYQGRAEAIHDALANVLAGMSDRLDEAVAANPLDASDVVSEVVGSFKPIAEAIEVNPTLSAESRIKLAKEYSDNMGLYVRDFSKREIQNLRKTVEKNAVAGYRFDTLIPKIEARYQVSKSKAAFLAEQETRLFMSEFREQRFSEAGVEQYVWRTSHDARVRHDHALLNGKVFRYDSPPVTNIKTQARNNPGQDFGCRCNDEPVIADMKRTSRGES